MTTPNMTNSEAYDAEILANAIRFEASLFLGKGKYAHASEPTLEDIKIAAEILKTEHPTIRGEAMIYALDEGGNKALVSGKPYKSKGKLTFQPTTDPKTWVTDDEPTETISSAGREDEIIDSAPLFGGISAIIAAAESANDIAGGIAAEHAATKLEADALDGFKPRRASAGKLKTLAAISADFAKPAKAPKAPKAEKPAAEIAPAVSKPRGPSGKYAAQLADAANGILPPEPDFSAETHKSYRKRLFAITAMIDAKDIAGLKAEATEPKCSSRIPLCRYRDMAITALEIQAQA